MNKKKDNYGWYYIGLIESEPIKPLAGRQKKIYEKWKRQ